MDVLGLDIGGANTKAVFVRSTRNILADSRTAVEYFPMWKEHEKLTSTLLTLRQRLFTGELDGVGVTMTAELSDAYVTKREGVNHVLGCVKKVFSGIPIYVLTSDATLVSVEQAIAEPLKVAAANWAATGWLVAQTISDCVVVDVGSTSTSIIPIVNGRVAAVGKTDLDKLICGELVYTGSLRTNVSTIVHSIPFGGCMSTVASELFALSADVHVVLGNITEKQYTCETTDGRGKSKSEALARIARVVCADAEMLTTQEIISMAEYIRDRQVMQVENGLNKVHTYAKKQASCGIPIVVTGLGKDFIARKAAEKVDAADIIDLNALTTQVDASIATPAFGVALMVANKIEGEPIKWT